MGYDQLQIPSVRECTEIARLGKQKGCYSCATSQYFELLRKLAVSELQARISHAQVSLLYCQETSIKSCASVKDRYHALGMVLALPW